MAFPVGFQWGVATASYQIEGAPFVVGGGYSVWDMFCRRPGAVSSGDSGTVACDHFNRYPEDVALMKTLGIPHYRMSIAWPRVLPDGTGKVSEEGLGFYDKLVDELLAAGIEPHVTLYHWDMPYSVYCRGGWLNRETTDWFADYARIVVDRLSDRVKSWMTLNEPQVYLGHGHQTGEHAPGDRLDWPEVLLAGHNSLIAHGKAAQVIRAHTKQPAEIGWAPVGVVTIPATDAPEDVAAAREAMFGIHPRSVWNNIWWDDPVFMGRYPEAGLAIHGHELPKGWEADMETVFQPTDFFGANIYNGHPVKRGADGKPEMVPHAPGIGRTIYHWPVTPSALYWGPKFYYERYKKPIVITENGIGLSDWIHLDGKVHDPQRIDFLDRYISEFLRAADDGVAVKGYYQWSFMDNFEWQEGLKHRFGLVHVDYQTQVRTPKDSAYWYRETIAANGANLKGYQANSTAWRG